MTILNTLQKIAQQAVEQDAQRPILDTIGRIEKLNRGLARFWSESASWAPDSAAALLGKSRLDWQVSLSRSLRHWITDPANAIDDGDLILAWANLGSLLEGTIKTFLSVYYEDYKADLENLKKTQAWHSKKEALLAPDGLRLEVLIQYCELAKLLPEDELELCRLVQTRRNAIHAFKDRPIGTGVEFQAAVREYLLMLRSTNQRLPYPDEIYMPHER
jgi:hypothetical protein